MHLPVWQICRKIRVMIDRDGLLRFRINNYLDARRARIERVEDGIGRMLVRQAGQDGHMVGWVSRSRHDARDYFIEAPPSGGAAHSRQLWLPAWRWINEYATAPQREIVATEAEPARRFAAWQDARPTVNDLEGYSPYDGQGQALFEEAKLILQFMDANNGGFDFSVTRD